MSTRSFDLSGKVIVITGGGTGIGREIALALSEHGANLVLIGRRERSLQETAAEIHRAGGLARVLADDVTDPASADRCLKQVLAGTGKVDVLFNNAGRSVRGPAEEISLEAWDSVVDLNLRAVFIWSQTFGRHMLARQEGVIVNTTSTMGFRPWKERLLNAVTRAAVEQMTRALAIEWASRGVRVNALAPGFVATPAMDPVLGDPELVAEVHERTPQRRILDARELRGIAVFLASEESSGMTGQVCRIDGGWTAW